MNTIPSVELNDGHRHWPLPTLYSADFVSTWKTFEEFNADGRARSIGVSNFQVDYLRRLAREAETVPAVNQIEAHPCLLNEEVRAYNREHGIATEAWSPLGRGAVLGDATITAIGERYGKSDAQVILRRHIQRGDIVVPKTITPTRMRENFEIFDFELAAEDMDAIAALDQGEEGRTGPHPDDRSSNSSDASAVTKPLLISMLPGTHPSRAIGRRNDRGKPVDYPPPPHRRVVRPDHRRRDRRSQRSTTARLGERGRRPSALLAAGDSVSTHRRLVLPRPSGHRAGRREDIGRDVRSPCSSAASLAP